MNGIAAMAWDNIPSPVGGGLGWGRQGARPVPMAQIYGERVPLAAPLPSSPLRVEELLGLANSVRVEGRGDTVSVIGRRV